MKDLIERLQKTADDQDVPPEVSSEIKEAITMILELQDKGSANT